MPVLNRADTLGGCLKALAAQSAEANSYEVIVVDDGSTDRSAQVAARHGVTVVRQDHAGAAAACNRGVLEARGSILLFTDADCEPQADWVEQMLAPLAGREVAGVKGAYRTWQDSLVARFAQAEYEEKYDRLARMKQIDFVDTHAAAYRRDLILAHGGFDPGFALEEDQEFSFRMAEAGHKLVFAPAAVVYHRHPPTISRYFQRKMQLGGWKVSVLARYPSKALCDSHTPWTRKAQILLLPLTLGAAMAAVLDLVPWIVIALLAVSSLASTIPLVPKAGQQGWHVAAATPVLALLRALALDLGMAWGVARWPGPKRWQGDKIQTRCPGGTSRDESGLM